MATGTEQAQSHVSTCLDHTRQLLLTYCRTCRKRVCEKCVKGPHSEHDWTFLQNHVREVRNEGQKIANEIRDEVIAFLKAKRDGTAKKQEVDRIRRMQANLKNLIDEYSDEMVSLLDDDDQITDLDIEIDEFEKLADFFETKMQIEYDSAVVEMEEELYAKLHQHRASKAADQDNARRFHEGTIDKDVIKSMMGRVEKVKESQNTGVLNMTVAKTVTHGENLILGIVAMAAEKAYIHSSGTENTPLLDQGGKVKDVIQYGTLFTDFIVKGQESIFTYYNKKYIGRLYSGKLNELCSTAPLGPNGICHSCDDGILVCLSDCSLSEIKPSSKGEVHHMDMTGRIKKRYYWDETDHAKLFTFPYRVAQNINYDLCVCDILENKKRQKLVVVSEDSRVRFIYEGQPSLKKKCTANAVVCDSLGRIILSDGHNNAIHMLSADGQFIQFLLTPKDGLIKPTALALHEDTMWVGNNKGIIKICKLKQSS